MLSLSIFLLPVEGSNQSPVIWVFTTKQTLPEMCCINQYVTIMFLNAVLHTWPTVHFALSVLHCQQRVNVQYTLSQKK